MKVKRVIAKQVSPHEREYVEKLRTISPDNSLPEISSMHLTASAS